METFFQFTERVALAFLLVVFWLCIAGLGITVVHVLVPGF